MQQNTKHDAAKTGADDSLFGFCTSAAAQVQLVRGPSSHTGRERGVLPEGPGAATTIPTVLCSATKQEDVECSTEHFALVQALVRVVLSDDHCWWFHWCSHHAHREMDAFVRELHPENQNFEQSMLQMSMRCGHCRRCEAMACVRLESMPFKAAMHIADECATDCEARWRRHKFTSSYDLDDMIKERRRTKQMDWYDMGPHKDVDWGTPKGVRIGIDDEGKMHVHSAEEWDKILLVGHGFKTEKKKMEESHERNVRFGNAFLIPFPKKGLLPPS